MCQVVAHLVWVQQHLFNETILLPLVIKGRGHREEGSTLELPDLHLYLLIPSFVVPFTWHRVCLSRELSF